MKSIAAVVLLTVLAGCASQSADLRYYLMRPAELPASAELVPSERYRMGRLQVASYIDQPGLLLEVAPGEVRAARQHLWAEPVLEGIETFLQQALSQELGEELLPATRASDAARINVRIDRLHGTTDGQALLVAYWWIDQAESTQVFRFTETRALATEGYAALYEAERQLLAELARRIAASLPE